MISIKTFEIFIWRVYLLRGHSIPTWTRWVRVKNVCFCPHSGYKNCPRRVGGTVCWNGVLRGHLLGIKMQHWNKYLSSLLYDFVSFWSTLSTPSQRDAWKKLKLPKVGKGRLKLSFFLWFTHWWNLLKFYKNELRL